MSDKKLSILGHLAELRKRLTRSVIVVFGTTIFSFIFYRQLIDILIYKSSITLPVLDFLVSKFNFFPIPEVNLIAIEMTEIIGVVFKVALAGGIILAMPYLTWEFIGFVAPALTAKEKKYVYLAIPWIALMFIIGVVFGYFILIPPAVKFLLTFGSDIVTPQIRIGNYISVVTRLLLVIGLIFEMPVVVTFLARIGVVKPKWLADKRKFAIIVAFVLSGLITPTFDPINQVIVAVPLILLYEMSIWLAKLVYKRRPETAKT